MKESTKAILACLALVAIFALGVTFSPNRSDKTLGSAPLGINAFFATSTGVLVGPGGSRTVFASSTTCVSRVISTQDRAINLSFDTAVTPSSTSGILQTGSTTVAYDSGIYGCGVVTAYGFVASSTINTSEFR